MSYGIIDRLKRSALWLFVAVLAASIVFLLLDIKTAADPPYLSLVLNILFIGIPLYYIAVLSARGFLRTGSWPVLWLGMGSFAFATATVGSSLILVAVSADTAVTMHNLVSVFAGATYVAGAFFAFNEIPALEGKTLRLISVVQVYAVAIAFVIFVIAMDISGLLPPFFVPGQGGTPLRQVVVETAVLLFLVAGLASLRQYYRSRSTLLYWYSLGLFLMALGLGGVLMTTTMGTPLNWIGRVSLLFGGVYLLVAGIVGVMEAKTRHVPAGEAMADLLGTVSKRLKEKEEALKATETRYQSLNRTMSEGLCLHEIIYDASGKAVDYRILDVNPAYEAITGLNREIALGKKASELYGTGRPPYIEIFAQVASSGKPDSFETYFPPMLRYFRVSVFSPAKGSFATVFSDITERKKSEEAIQQVMERLELAYDAAGAGAWDWDVVAGHIEWSPKMFELLGLDPQKAAASFDTWGKVLHAEDRELAASRIDRALKEHTALNSEYRIVLPDGRIRWINAIGKGIYNDNGQPYRMIGVCTDITERKKSENELQRINRELRAISECNQAIVRASDEKVMYEEICQIMCEVVGYRMAWVGVVEHNEVKSVRPIVWYGNETGYLEKANITWADTELGRGPTGVAARTGRTDFCQDFETEEKMAAWREAALARGFRSSIALPLFDRDGVIFAVFTMYAAEPEGFTPSEVRLLEGLTGDLAFGIGVLQTKREQILAEDRLRETSDYLNNLLDYANAPIIVWDPAYKITRFNHSFERLTGMTSEEVMGRQLDVLFPDSSKAESMAYIGRASSGEHWEVVEIPILHKDGSIRTVLWNSATIYDKDGTAPLATIAQGNDITERKKVEYALSETALRYRTVAENTYDFEFWLSPEGKYIYASPSCWRIYGRTADELQSDPALMRRMVHPDDLDVFDRHVNGEAGHKSSEVEFRILHTDGTYRWIMHVCQPVFDENGRYLGIRGSNRDVSPRKKAEAAVLHLATFPELNPQPVMEVDLNGAVTYQNPAARKLLPDLTQAGSGHPFLENWQDVTNTLRDGQIRFMSREVKVGSAWYEQTIISDRVTGNFRIYARDITEHKQADAIKDEFIGMVSHEIKTPLTVIIGSLSVAMEEGVPENEARELIRSAFEYAENLAGITENLLELSRYQSHRLNLQPAQSDIAEISNNVIDKLSSRSDRHHLVMDIPAGIPTIIVDPLRIERVIYNLIENAIKYSPNGGEVKIFARQKDSELVVGVSDQGIGISAEDQSRLFKSFERLDAYEEYSIPGLGLGLRVCDTLVSAHGGRIWLESEKGKGSVFYFSIPLDRKVQSSVQ